MAWGRKKKLTHFSASFPRCSHARHLAEPEVTNHLTWYLKENDLSSSRNEFRGSKDDDAKICGHFISWEENGDNYVFLYRVSNNERSKKAASDFKRLSRFITLIEEFCQILRHSQVFMILVWMKLQMPWVWFWQTEAKNFLRTFFFRNENSCRRIFLSL